MKKRVTSAAKAIDDELANFGLDDVDKPMPHRPWPTCRYGKWPDTVPVMVASDLCWNLTQEDGRKDLLCWLDAIFDSDTVKVNPKRDKAKRVLEQVLAERLQKPTVSLWILLEKAQQRKRPSLRWQSHCWNEMAHRLGYAVPRSSRQDIPQE